MKKIIISLTVALTAVLLAFTASAACYHRNVEKQTSKLPTCYEEGELEIWCEDCGALVKTQKIKKENHKLESNWTVVEKATCYKEGCRQKKCTNEGCDYVKEESIDKKSHSFPSAYTTVEEATCYREGLKTRVCKNDGCDYVEKKDIPKKSHKWSSWETVKVATCNQSGKRERYCENEGCDATDVDDITPPSHKWSTWETIEEATCSKEGMKQRHCKNDGCDKVETDTIDTKKHSFGSWEVIEKSTCSDEGMKQRVCKICSAKELADIPKTKHDWGKWKTIEEAYEDEDGIRSRECSVCGEIQTEDVEIDCGDDYTYKVIREATCTTDGSREKYCANKLSNGKTCGRKLGTEKIPALGHKWTAWNEVYAPTATSDGKERRTCKVSTCRQEETRATKIGHGDSWKTQVTKEATCLEEGTKEDICDCCGESIKTVIIPKKGHTYESTWTIIEAATPEKNGTRYKKCTTPSCTKQNIEYYPWDDGVVLENMPFLDVKPVAWYFENVKKCYAHGLIKGTTETMYSPSGEITVGQVITLAVRIHCANNPDVAKPETDTKPWYKGYVDYAVENSIIRENDFTDMNKPATRGEMAYIFASASDETNLQKINNYKSIPDVSADHKYAEEIFLLYNAGIVEGNDAGLYQPEAKITRAECATIIARICNYTARKMSGI